jgi:hypothetical protein
MSSACALAWGLGGLLPAAVCGVAAASDLSERFRETYRFLALGPDPEENAFA